MWLQSPNDSIEGLISWRWFCSYLHMLLYLSPPAGLSPPQPGTPTFQEHQRRHCKVSWDLERLQYHFCHILLVKASHKKMKIQEGEEIAFSPWWEWVAKSYCPRMRYRDLFLNCGLFNPPCQYTLSIKTTGKEFFYFHGLNILDFKYYAK